MFDPYKALYIHLPFCRQRCFYCDFTTEAAKQDDPRIDTYLDAMVLDIRRAAKEGSLAQLDTVYLGGGTPSYVGKARLSKLLYTLAVFMHLTSDVECSMEANPDSLDEALVKDMWALGVNRLSIGVQSFNDSVLRSLGRIHSADDARRAITTAQKRFENVSIDLMCGIPGQTFEDFQASLEEALSWGVKHISVYPLTVEPGTLLDKKILSGEIEEPDQDQQALMMQMAASVLEPAGLQRYEVASYAEPGFECRHNIAYWTGKPYLGLGVSAVSMMQNESNRKRIQDEEVVDDLNRRQMLAEDIMLSMRMTQGISETRVQNASLLLPEILVVFHELSESGFVERDKGYYKPTLAGWLCGNEMYGKILALAP